jgi:hypothetical protein
MRQHGSLSYMLFDDNVGIRSAPTLLMSFKPHGKLESVVGHYVANIPGTLCCIVCHYNFGSAVLIWCCKSSCGFASCAAPEAAAGDVICHAMAPY